MFTTWCFRIAGAVVRSWILKDYKDTRGKPLELVNQQAPDRVPAPFRWMFKGQTPRDRPQ